MKFGRRGVVLVVVVLVAALAAWVFRPTRPSSSSTQLTAAAPADSAAPAAASTAGNKLPARHGQAGAAPDTVTMPRRTAASAALPSGRFDAIRPQLEAMARSGDARAAYRLAQIYSKCAHWEPMSPEQERKILAETRASTEAKDGPGASVDIGDLRVAIHRVSDPVDALCAPLGKVPVDNNGPEYLRWLRMAAVDGDPRAMVEYAGSVVPVFTLLDQPPAPRIDSPLGRAEDILRYREEAITFLDRALAMGEPEALLEMAHQYSNGTDPPLHGGPSLYAPDLVRAYAFLLAYLSTAAAQNPRVRGRGMFLMMQLQSDLNADQMAAAAALAKQIESGFVERIVAGDDE